MADLLTLQATTLERAAKVLAQEPQQKVVICDLDGTLASCEWRRHFVEPTEGRHKDWNSFFAGIPFDPVVPAVKQMLEGFIQQGMQVIYVSARPSDRRRATIDWLTKHDCPGGPPYRLYMRRAGDSRHDPVVKQEILDGPLKALKDAGLIHLVIDDRPQVVQMWRQNGLDVHQVEDPGIKPPMLKESTR